jgi:ABC-type methionine transport system ATPase subunit
MLEHQMQAMRDLPERVAKLESQVLQLRQEMRDEFSATRNEFRAELNGAVSAVKDQLHEEIRAASERTETLMRVLHQEALARIATIGEGRRPRRKK